MADSGRLDELNRKFDENPRRYFAPLANEYRKSGDLERAIELCRAYLPQQPGHMSGYIVYGQALFDAGRGDQAAAIFQQALSIDPENIIALRHLGDIARSAGDSDAALRWYRRVVEVDPKNEEILLYISQLSFSAPTFQPPQSPVPAPLHKVHPEPEAEVGAVVLSELVHQPDFSQPVQVADQDHTADLPSINEFVFSVPTEERLTEVDVIHGSHTEETKGDDKPEADRMDPPFLTETMADLYRQQGFTAEALEIYQRLAKESDDPGVREKAQELEQAIEMERQSTVSAQPDEPSLPPSLEPQPIAQITVRDFFVRIGARSPQHTQPSPIAAGGLGDLFSSAHLDGSDINAATALADAYTSAR